MRSNGPLRTVVSSQWAIGFIRKPPKRVDYLLRYTRDFPLAVVEAKAVYKSAADGLQQAKTYAEMLGLKFAYATNGHDLIEFDYFTGLETILPAVPDTWGDENPVKLGNRDDPIFVPFQMAVSSALVDQKS